MLKKMIRSFAAVMVIALCAMFGLTGCGKNNNKDGGNKSTSEKCKVAIPNSSDEMAYTISTTMNLIDGSYYIEKGKSATISVTINEGYMPSSDFGFKVGETAMSVSADNLNGVTVSEYLSTFSMSRMVNYSYTVNSDIEITQTGKVEKAKVKVSAIPTQNEDDIFYVKQNENGNLDRRPVSSLTYNDFIVSYGDAIFFDFKYDASKDYSYARIVASAANADVTMLKEESGEPYLFNEDESSYLRFKVKPYENCSVFYPEEMSTVYCYNVNIRTDAYSLTVTDEFGNETNNGGYSLVRDEFGYITLKFNPYFANEFDTLEVKANEAEAHLNPSFNEFVDEYGNYYRTYQITPHSDYRLYVNFDKNVKEYAIDLAGEQKSNNSNDFINNGDVKLEKITKTIDGVEKVISTNGNIDQLYSFENLDSQNNLSFRIKRGFGLEFTYIIYDVASNATESDIYLTLGSKEAYLSAVKMQLLDSAKAVFATKSLKIVQNEYNANKYDAVITFTFSADDVKTLNDSENIYYKFLGFQEAQTSIKFTSTNPENKHFKVAPCTINGNTISYSSSDVINLDTNLNVKVNKQLTYAVIPDEGYVISGTTVDTRMNINFVTDDNGDAKFFTDNNGNKCLVFNFIVPEVSKNIYEFEMLGNGDIMQNTTESPAKVSINLYDGDYKLSANSANYLSSEFTIFNILKNESIVQNAKVYWAYEGSSNKKLLNPNNDGSYSLSNLYRNVCIYVGETKHTFVFDLTKFVGTNLEYKVANETWKTVTSQPVEVYDVDVVYFRFSIESGYRRVVVTEDLGDGSTSYHDSIVGYNYNDDFVEMGFDENRVMEFSFKANSTDQNIIFTVADNVNFAEEISSYHIKINGSNYDEIYKYDGEELIFDEIIAKNTQIKVKVTSENYFYKGLQILVNDEEITAYLERKNITFITEGNFIVFSPVEDMTFDIISIKYSASDIVEITGFEALYKIGLSDMHSGVMFETGNVSTQKSNVMLLKNKTYTFYFNEDIISQYDLTTLEINGTKIADDYSVQLTFDENGQIVIENLNKKYVTVTFDTTRNINVWDGTEYVNAPASMQVLYGSNLRILVEKEVGGISYTDKSVYILAHRYVVGGMENKIDNGVEYVISDITFSGNLVF